MSAPNYVPYLERSTALYGEFERKSGDPTITHYCPGCGHGALHKMIAEAIEDLGVKDKTVFVSPVGCSVFGYYYFDVGNVQAAHGRAPAVGTGVQRSRPHSIVISYQGDGDLAAIGLNEILQAANRGEKMAVFFVNNAIYGMTGGQMAPTTLPGMRTTTSPNGRDPRLAGNPVHMCELVAQLDAPIYVARGALATPKETKRTRKLVRKALEMQAEGKGFTFVEVLAACPTGWGMTPVDSHQWIIDNMKPVFPLEVFVDRTDGEHHAYVAPEPPKPEELHEVLRIKTKAQKLPEANWEEKFSNPQMKVAGFGGQGVLLLGLGLAQCGMLEGRKVSWLPSYGPEMRGGTAHCHVNISAEEIGSPLVSRPTVLIAMNQPSLDKFEEELMPGALVITNKSLVPRLPKRDDLNLFEISATEIAEELGNARAANMVILGAYAGASGALNLETCLAALDALIKRKELVELNRKAVEAGFEAGVKARG